MGNRGITFNTMVSLWKIDEPIGRFFYFLIVLSCLVFGGVVTLLSDLLGIWLFPILLVFLLFMLWLYFVSTVKRFYDIIGDKKKAVIITVAAFLLNFLYVPFGFVILAVGFFLQGKYIK